MAKRTSNWIRKNKRLAIYARDNHKCAYCSCELHIGAPIADPQAATLDHVRAHNRGGSNAASNLVSCCARCNSRKQDVTMKVWLTRLDSEGLDAEEIKRTVRNATRRTLRIAA